MLKFVDLDIFSPVECCWYLIWNFVFAFWILNLNLYDSGVKSAYQVRAAWKNLLFQFYLNGFSESSYFGDWIPLFKSEQLGNLLSEFHNL